MATRTRNQVVAFRITPAERRQTSALAEKVPVIHTMATCSFIKERKQTAGSTGRVIQHVSQPKKTMDGEGNRYLTGVNCVADAAMQSLMVIKHLYGKDTGTFTPIWWLTRFIRIPEKSSTSPPKHWNKCGKLAIRSVWSTACPL